MRETTAALHAGAHADIPPASESPLAHSLDGVRVLDLTSVIMGPVCTQILAGYGADVVKIEPPEGDIMRHAGAARESGMGAMFLHANRGKRSLVVDLKSTQGQALLRRLLPGFDVLVHNIRPDAVARLGLGYAEARAARSDLIYAELTGYSPAGPYGGQPAFDDVIQAQSGIAHLFQRQSGDAPRYLPALVADRMTGLVAAHRILAAVCARHRTGEGGYINISMFETMAAFTLSDHLGGHSFEPPVGSMGYSRLLTPHRRPYATRDGHVAVVVYNDKHWRTFFDVIGRPEVFLADARFQTAAARADSYDHIYAYLADVLRGDTTASWLARLAAADIPCARINTLEDLIEDPHLRKIGFFAMAAGADGMSRSIHDGPGASTVPSPRRGACSRAVLLQAGLQPEEVNQLVASGVVGESS